MASNLDSPVLKCCRCGLPVALPMCFDPIYCETCMKVLTSNDNPVVDPR